MKVNNIRTGDSPKNTESYYLMRGRGGLPLRVTSNNVAVMRASDAALSVNERAVKLQTSRNCATRLIDPANMLVELSELGAVCELQHGSDKYQVVLGVAARAFTPEILEAMGDFCFDYSYSGTGQLVHVGESFARRAVKLINPNDGTTSCFNIINWNMALSITEKWSQELKGSGIHSFWVKGDEKDKLMLFEMNPPGEYYRRRFPLKVNKGTGLVIARKLKGGS